MHLFPFSWQCSECCIRILHILTEQLRNVRRTSKLMLPCLKKQVMKVETCPKRHPPCNGRKRIILFPQTAHTGRNLNFWHFANLLVAHASSSYLSTMFPLCLTEHKNSKFNGFTDYSYPYDGFKIYFKWTDTYLSYLSFASLIANGLANKVEWVGRKDFSPLQDFSDKSAVLTLTLIIVISKQPNNTNFLLS